MIDGPVGMSEKLPAFRVMIFIMWFNSFSQRSMDMWPGNFEYWTRERRCQTYDITSSASPKNGISIALTV